MRLYLCHCNWGHPLLYLIAPVIKDIPCCMIFYLIATVTGCTNLTYCRWDISKSLTYYNTTHRRTLESIQECSTLPKSKPAQDRKGVQQPPIIHLDPKKIVIDELHLLLRIGDVLIRNIVHEMVHADKTANHYSSQSIQQLCNLNQLQHTINDHCKVTFRVWEKRDPDGRPSGKYDWTSLMGADVKRS